MRSYEVSPLEFGFHEATKKLMSFDLTIDNDGLLDLKPSKTENTTASKDGLR